MKPAGMIQLDKKKTDKFDILLLYNSKINKKKKKSHGVEVIISMGRDVCFYNESNEEMRRYKKGRT